MSDTSDDDLIPLLKRAMSIYGLTQAKLAQELRTSQSYISLILKGKRDITAQLREQILKFLVNTARTENQAAKNLDPDGQLTAQISQLWAKDREELAKQTHEFNAIIGRKYGASPAQMLSRTVLLAAYAHITLQHTFFHNGVAGLDVIGDIVSERIRWQLESMRIDQHSAEENCRMLGTYIARLELLLAQYVERISDLEKQLAEKTPAAPHAESERVDEKNLEGQSA